MMKKILLLLLPVLFFSCTRSSDKPKLSIDEYNRQAYITKGMLEKILAESDYKKMHEIAQAVESSRAVNCVSIGEECNVYGEILNQIVTSSQSALPNESQNVAIYKKIGEFDIAVKSGQDILMKSWKEYYESQRKQP
jgi:hypothetical protein